MVRGMSRRILVWLSRPVLHHDVGRVAVALPQSGAQLLGGHPDGPFGVHVNAPVPRRKVASRSNTTRPSGRVTVTCTADSFDTLKRSATGSSSAPVAGPS